MINDCQNSTFQFILETRGLEALTRKLFVKFSVIIIGFCVKSEVQ